MPGLSRAEVEGVEDSGFGLGFGADSDIELDAFG